MNVDAIRREIALLEREIAVIKHELSEARRDSVRAVLNQELKEKEVEKANLLNQIEVNIGDSNSLSAENMIIGSTIGRDINQYTHSSNVDMHNSTVSENAVIAGRDVYIYPNSHAIKSKTPIKLRIDLEAMVSKSIGSVIKTEGILFKRQISISSEFWKKEVPFKLIAEIKDTVTKESMYHVLCEGSLHLQDTSTIREVAGFWNTISQKLVESYSYVSNKTYTTLIINSIVNLLGKLSQDGYDVDEKIIDFNEYLAYNYRIDVYREEYKTPADAYDATSIGERYPEFHAKIGVNRTIIFDEIIMRRKSL